MKQSVTYSKLRHSPNISQHHSFFPQLPALRLRPFSFTPVIAIQHCRVSYRTTPCWLSNNAVFGIQHWKQRIYGANTKNIWGKHIRYIQQSVTLSPFRRVAYVFEQNFPLMRLFCK